MKSFSQGMTEIQIHDVDTPLNTIFFFKKEQKEKILLLESNIRKQQKKS